MLRFALDIDPLRNEIGRLRRQRLPSWRRQLIDALGQSLLDRILRLTPVDTGRTRAAFVAPLQQLGGTPPANWQGPHPDFAALREGTDAGTLQRQDSETATTLEITNAVAYAPYLEYGTAQAAPHAMIRRTFAQSQSLLASLLEPL